MKKEKNCNLPGGVGHSFGWVIVSEGVV